MYGFVGVGRLGEIISERIGFGWMIEMRR